jgi:hypothetical protein
MIKPVRICEPTRSCWWVPPLSLDGDGGSSLASTAREESTQLRRWWLGAAGAAGSFLTFARTSATDHFIFAAVGSVLCGDRRQYSLVPVPGAVFFSVDKVLSFVERRVVLVIPVELVGQIGY